MRAFRLVGQRALDYTQNDPVRRIELRLSQDHSNLWGLKHFLSVFHFADFAHSVGIQADEFESRFAAARQARIDFDQISTRLQGELNLPQYRGLVRFPRMLEENEENSRTIYRYTSGMDRAFGVYFQTAAAMDAFNTSGFKNLSGRISTLVSTYGSEIASMCFPAYFCDACGANDNLMGVYLGGLRFAVTGPNFSDGYVLNNTMVFENIRVNECPLCSLSESHLDGYYKDALFTPPDACTCRACR